MKKARIKKLANGKFIAEIYRKQYSFSFFPEWLAISNTFNRFLYKESDSRQFCICDTYSEALDALSSFGVGEGEFDVI